MSRTRTPSAAAALLAAALAFVLLVAPANAATVGVASQAQSVGSATWAAVATTTVPTGSPTGALNLTIPTIGTPQYFWVTNTGTADLSQTRFTVAYAVSATGLGVGYLEIRACVGAGASWNEVTNVCTGGAAQQLTTTGGTPGGGAVAAPTTAGTRVRLQLRAVGIAIAVTGTVSVTVACS